MATKQTVTLRDLATAAGVSVGTVSRALKNQTGLSEETRAAILRKAQELGYDASKLRAEKPRRILFLINRSHASLSDNPFYSVVLQGVEEACREEHISLSLLSVGPGDAIQTCIRRREPDALLSVGFFDAEMLAEMKKTELPTVLVDHYTADRFCVNDDNVVGAMLATRHLLEQGCKRVAMIGGPVTHHSISLRWRGYRKALFEARCLADPELEVTLDPNLQYPEATVLAMNRLLDLPDPPDGVFAYNDATAIGAMQVCVERGLRVPEDIAFVGYDDIVAAANHRPTLTTIKVNKEELGRRAACHLINGNTGQGEELLPVELLVRESSLRKM